ncbi:MAG: AMP-binding protein, partial [Myxococcales bacterium]|nr:AMP-binding protein [Myxococcales bacterium]
MNVALWLDRAGRAHPTAPAIGVGKQMYCTYADLAQSAARIAGGLRALGLERGDRVAIVSKNHPEYLPILFGIWHAGLAAVPTNARLHGIELGYILEHSGARVCLASRGIDGQVASYAPRSLDRLITIGSAEYDRLAGADPLTLERRAASDLAWLFYTSGTTGRPKGVMLTHRNLSWASHAYLSEVEAVLPGDAILHAAPLSHGTGAYSLPHIARLGVNVIPESGGFEPEEIAAVLPYWRGLSMFAAPTMIKQLVACRTAFDPAGLRTVIWGGAPMYVEDLRHALERFGPRLAQIYGQGECPMTITTLTKAAIADREHPRWL